MEELGEVKTMLADYDYVRYSISVIIVNIIRKLIIDVFLNHFEHHYH